MKNYVGVGDTMKITAGAAITAGDLIATNECVGVAQNDAASGASCVMAIEGVFRLAKNTSTAINEGDLVDWDVSAEEVSKGITPAAGDVENFGIAMETVAAAGAYINVKLIPGGGTFN